MTERTVRLYRQSQLSIPTVKDGGYLRQSKTMKRNAEAGTRTLTALRPPDPESGASTNSATPAQCKVYTGDLFCQSTKRGDSFMSFPTVDQHQMQISWRLFFQRYKVDYKQHRRSPYRIEIYNLRPLRSSWTPKVRVRFKTGPKA